MELQDLTLNHFTSINDVKIQFTDEVILPAQVLQVIALSGYSPISRTPFSLLFRTSQVNEYYNQGTFVVHHPDLNEIVMFLSPKGFDGVGMTYEAIFS